MYIQKYTQIRLKVQIEADTYMLVAYVEIIHKHAYMHIYVCACIYLCMYV